MDRTLAEQAGRLIPIEVKLSQTPRSAMGTSIRALQRDLEGKVGHGYVVFPGDFRLPLGPGVTAWPFTAL